MLNNLQLRWAIIVAALAFSLYFIYPSIQFYMFNNQSKEDKTIKLGLDLKGGLNIILELDEYVFMERLSKKRLSKQSKLEYNNLLQDASEQAATNKTFIYDELLILSDQKGIKLNKFFSNLSKSSNNSDIINEIKDQKIYAMNNILDIMRNRISEHDQYGLGEPSIQQLGSNRLVVELAGISDVSRAKEYIQRTADFELSLVKKQTDFFDIVSNINKYIINNSLDFPSLDSLMFPDQSSEGYLVEENNVKLLMNFLNSTPISPMVKSSNKIVLDHKAMSFDFNNSNTSPAQLRRIYLVSDNPAIESGMIQTPKAVVSDAGTDNAGQWVVNLDMNKNGRRKWAKFTGDHINRQVAIILD